MYHRTSSASPYAALSVTSKETDDDAAPTKEEIGEFYLNNHRKFIETFTVQNHKVRYYCNATTAMRQPLYNIVDDLINVQKKAMAYLSQSPPNLDHYLLAMMFTMIEKITNMIDWKTMNRKCFWKDFCRESRHLRHLISQAQAATLDCCHTVVDKANRAMEILQEEFSPDPGKRFADADESKLKKWMKIERDETPLKESYCQSPGDPSRLGIKAVCSQPYESFEIQWIDTQDNNVRNVTLLQMSDSFRLRLLRSLMSCARKALELIILSMYRIEIVLRTEFRLEKLAKCEGITPSQLLPHERAVLFKSKREFDFLWQNIMFTICRFRLQLQQLDKHRKTCKMLVRDSKYSMKIFPKADKITLKIEDPLLIRFVDQITTAELSDETYDFTMYSDRSHDIAEIIQDMWNISKMDFKTMEMLINLVYLALSHVFEVLNTGERKDLRNMLLKIFEQRDKVKRYLKKSLSIFSHASFQELPIHLNSMPSKGFAKVFTTGVDTLEAENDDSSVESDDEESKDPFWIQLPRGFEVTIVGEQKIIVIVNHLKQHVPFKLLFEAEKLIVVNKLIVRLFHSIASEACLAKITCDRSSETKSLMKRMKQTERKDPRLVATIANGLNHVKNILKLMKMMNGLLIFTKKV